MPDEMTFEAAVIEANRLKSQERMDVDRERLNAAIDKLIEAARFRIKRTVEYNEEAKDNMCPRCGSIFIANFCPRCGQAIDWSDYR